MIWGYHHLEKPSFLMIFHLKMDECGMIGYFICNLLTSPCFRWWRKNRFQGCGNHQGKCDEHVVQRCWNWAGQAQLLWFYLRADVEEWRSSVRNNGPVRIDISISNRIRLVVAQLRPVAQRIGRLRSGHGDLFKTWATEWENHGNPLGLGISHPQFM